MAKAKTSKKPKTYIDVTKLTDCKVWSPTAEILNPKNLADLVAECLINNDPEGVIEAIEVYLETIEMVKTKMAKKSSLSRATLYHTLKNKNPTIKTLAKIIHAAAA